LQLNELEGKVELRVRAIYDERALMTEIVSQWPEIARLRAQLRDKPAELTYYERINLGQLVAAAIEQTRERDTDLILDALAPLALANTVEEPEHEHVLARMSFLVERKRMPEFDRAVDELGRGNHDRMSFKYTGPLPAYSFVQLPA
jgi:Gas vesicle synthesis protein GvpL/GvpF